MDSLCNNMAQITHGTAPALFVLQEEGNDTNTKEIK